MDEELLIQDSEVIIATKALLSELYPVRKRNPRAFIQVRRKPRRNAILNKYRGESTSLSARGFDTTELDNRIAVEQTRTDTLYPPE